MTASGTDSRPAPGQAGKCAADKSGVNTSLRKSLALATTGGILAAIYSSVVGSPAAIDFFRAIGATEFDIGLIQGIPAAMLFMQFVASWIANFLRSRRILFISLLVASRLLYFPIAVLPLLCPWMKASTTMMIVVVLVTISSALANLAVPLWFTWMADLIPHRVLNTYWGTRQRWTQIAWVASYLVVTFFTYAVNMPIKTAFLVMLAPALLVGIIDLLLFLWVREPANTRISGVTAVQMFLAPFRDRNYRTFLGFSCIWSVSTMIAASFLLYYVLKVLHVSLWETTLMWAVQGISTGLAAGPWGRIADKHGHRPILGICVSVKAMIMLVFILVDEVTVHIALPLAFVIDGALNAGNFVAANGYMIKLAPKENRSMFISSITGLPGMCAGAATIVAGYALRQMSDFTIDAFGRTWINFQMLFLLSMLMRIGCIPIVRMIREPKSTPTAELLSNLAESWSTALMELPRVFLRRNGSSSRKTSEDAEPKS